MGHNLTLEHVAQSFKIDLSQIGNYDPHATKKQEDLLVQHGIPLENSLATEQIANPSDGATAPVTSNIPEDVAPKIWV